MILLHCRRSMKAIKLVSLLVITACFAFFAGATDSSDLILISHSHPPKPPAQHPPKHPALHPPKPPGSKPSRGSRPPEKNPKREPSDDGKDKGKDKDKDKDKDGKKAATGEA